jgi:RNA polymerase sigma-70 factor (ECF subfamily)
VAQFLTFLSILSGFGGFHCGNARSLCLDWVRAGIEVHVNSQDGAHFVQLYSAYESRLRGYVQSLIPKWSDADDVLQRSNLVLWKKFDKYEPGSNFFAWACQIVRLEVLKFRESAARDKMVFTEAFLDAVDQHTIRRSDELQTRIDLLQQCVAKLSPDHQELLRLCYDEQRTIVSVAEQLNRKVDGVYKALSRIHLALYGCVSRRMAKVQP